MTDYDKLFSRAEEAILALPDAYVTTYRALMNALREALAERDEAVERAGLVDGLLRAANEQLADLESERVTVAEALAEAATYEDQLAATREKLREYQERIDSMCERCQEACRCAGRRHE